MKEKGITRVSSKDLHELEDLTDWKALRAMTEEDIERAAASDPDAPMTTAKDWKNARMVWPDGKEKILVAIDRDIVQSFGNRNLNCQSEINEVLRAHVEAHSQKKKTGSRSRPTPAHKPRRKAPRRAAVKS